MILNQHFQKAAEQLSGYTVDAFSRIHIIKELSGKNYERKKFSMRLQKFVRAAFKKRLVNQIASAFINFFGNFWVLMIIWFGGKDVFSRNMTIGELFAFMMYANILANPINFIVSFILSMQTIKVGFIRIVEFLDFPHEIHSKDLDKAVMACIKTNLEDLPWKIEVKNLNFSYDNRNLIFEDYSCVFPSKGLTLLFAPSGAGKSTLCKLLIRYFDSYDGIITINSINIKEIPVDYIRRNVIYLNQNQYTFNGSVLDNIIYGEERSFSEKEINDAVIDSSSEFVFEFPNKLNSNFLENNFNVSQGQAQRIAITRAILKKPKILILDEPTSSVDKQSEQKIYSTLIKLKNYCSIILVSHKNNAKDIADNMLLFPNRKNWNSSLTKVS